MVSTTAFETGSSGVKNARGLSTWELMYTQLKQKSFSSWTVKLNRRVCPVVYLLTLKCSMHGAIFEYHLVGSFVSVSK